MRRARAASLDELEPWLDEVRGLGIAGLVEKANRAFYRRSTAMLHFHEDDTGVHADVKLGGDWVRIPVDDAGRRRILELLAEEYGPR